jgi:hypothetical protein
MRESAVLRSLTSMQGRPGASKRAGEAGRGDKNYIFLEKRKVVVFARRSRAAQ